MIIYFKNLVNRLWGILSVFCVQNRIPKVKKYRSLGILEGFGQKLEEWDRNGPEKGEKG